MKRDTYIDNIPIQDAKDKYYNKLKIDRQVEVIHILESLGRVTSQAIFANISSPHYNAEAMDGIGVISKKTDDK